MATQLFLRDDLEAGVSVGSFLEHQLRDTRGDNAVVATVATTASGNHKVMQMTSTDAIWLYQINAVTVSGTITFNLWGVENAMAANAGLAAIVSRYNSAGTFVSDVVAQANAAHADGVELGTSYAAMNWTATPTNTTFNAGDWLAVVLHADAVGTMGAGSADIALDAPTAAATGDSYVTFTETITQFVAANSVPRKIYVINQTINRAANW